MLPIGRFRIYFSFATEFLKKGEKVSGESFVCDAHSQLAPLTYFISKL